MRHHSALALTLLAVGGLASGPALAQQITPVGPGSIEFETDNDITFRFGISTDFQPTWTSNLDFNDDTNFRTITEFGAIGDDDDTGFIGLETRLYFSVAKDRLSLYTAFELDGTLDARTIDDNNPNIERINISLQIPEINSTLTAGADVYFLDGIGGLVYIDDDPGIWLKGGSGPWSWQAGWHKRLEFGGAAGDTGGRFAARAGVTEDRSDDTDFLSAKLGYDLKHSTGTFRFEPFGLVQFRDSPSTGSGQTRLNLVGPGNEARPAGDPLQASIADVVPNQTSYFLGLAGMGSFGIFKPRAQFVYSGGEISGLRDDNGVTPFGFDEFDISSYAAYARLDIDVSQKSWWPFGGFIPFVQGEILSGDDEPFDDELEGFVSPSSPNGLRPADFPFLRKTVLGLGSPVLGDGTANFGFATDGRGIGPTIGNILEGATFGGTALFNNRFGKGDNPGFVKLSLGAAGAFDPKWSLHLAGNYVRFSETESIEAEFGALDIGSVDKDIGYGLDMVLIYRPQPQFQVRPFFSVFVPGDGAEQLAGSDDTAYVGGIGFFAAF